MGFTILETILIAVLLAVYITCLFTVAAVTFRNGHWILGILGIFFPLFWLIGAVLAPTPAAIRNEKALLSSR